MKLSEEIRAETKYSVYLKWADKAEHLEVEHAWLKEEVRISFIEHGLAPELLDERLAKLHD